MRSCRNAPAAFIERRDVEDLPDAQAGHARADFVEFVSATNVRGGAGRLRLERTASR